VHCNDEGGATQTAGRTGSGARPAGLPTDTPSAGRLPDLQRRGRHRETYANAPGWNRMRELLPLLRAGGRRRQNTQGTRWRGRGAPGGAAVMVFSRNPCFGPYHGGKGGQCALCVPHSRNGTRARCARASWSLSKSPHSPNTYARARSLRAKPNWHFGTAHKKGDAKGGRPNAFSEPVRARIMGSFDLVRSTRARVMGCFPKGGKRE
jgi:hypothetical protein